MIVTDENDKLWEAVLLRDKSKDGVFVYAVRSTGIYCRPTCPSRRPARQNVVFFQEPSAAESAGFRACQRCRPTETEANLELARNVCRYIENKLEELVSLEALGEAFYVSPAHLQRVFKSVMSITPRQYAEAYRLDQLKLRLKEGEGVTTAMHNVGYGSSSRLYEKAPSQLGMTPMAYREGGKGVRINYTVAECELGWMLVAASDKGLCAVSLGDEATLLEKAVRQEYPQAQFERDEAGLKGWVEQILNHLAGRQPQLDLPLAVSFTPFQGRVWSELRKIPYGSTRSYSQIAQSLGQPGAVRAVARACATNPVALVIPCHRVIRENGELAGYRWGLARKERLLALEVQTERMKVAV